MGQFNITRRYWDLMQRVTGKSSAADKRKMKRRARRRTKDLSLLVESLEPRLLLAVSPTDLVASWNFNEGTGLRAADTAPYGISDYGTLRDHTTWNRYGSSGAISLDGSGDWVETAVSTDINNRVTTSRTVSAWFYVSDKAANGRNQVIFEEGGDQRGLSMYVSNGRLYVGGWNTPVTESGWSGTFLSTDQFQSGRWHHVALVLSGGDTVTAGALRGYLDGVEFASGAGSKLWAHSDPVGIGQGAAYVRFHTGVSAGGHGFAGMLDDIRVYNRCLTTIELAELASQAMVAPGSLTLDVAPSSLWENGAPISATVGRTGNTTGTLTVALASSNAARLNVPTSVTFAAGQLTASFSIEPQDNALADGTTRVTLSGTAQGFEAAQDSFDIWDDEPSTQGLVVYWAMNEGSGTTVADTAPQGTNDVGTLKGDVTWSPTGIGRSVSFGGSTGILAISDSAEINLTAVTQRTVSLWFNANAGAWNSARQVIFEEGGTDRGINIYLDSGRLYVGGWNVATTESKWSGTYLSTDNVQAGQWYHVALVLSGGTTVQANGLKAYLDGTLFGAGSGSQLWSHGDDTGLGRAAEYTRFHSGVGTPNAHGMAGLIDEARIYNRVLGDSEIVALAGQKPASGDGLTVSLVSSSMSESNGVVQGSVTRSGSTATEVVVLLSSSDSTEAVLPASVTIAAGQSSAVFTVSAVNDLIRDGNQTLTISAQAAGLGASTATLLVTDDEQLLVRGVLANVSNEWVTVTLPQQYNSMVVIATPNYTQSSIPLVPRIRNATGSSFEIRVDRTDGLAVPVTGIGVQYVVAEEGVYTVAKDGIKMEAVKYTSTVTDRVGSWVGETRSYAQTYASPVVVGQVQSYNDSDFSVFWSQGASKASPASSNALRVGKHIGEDPDTTRAAETVGYLVLEAGLVDLGSTKFLSGTGAATIQGMDNAPPFSYSINGLAVAGVMVASLAGMAGDQGGWAVLYGADAVNASRVQLAAEEDQALDTERVHVAESVSYLVFEDESENDPPRLTLPGNQTANEDTDHTISGIAVYDVDAAGGDLRVSLAASNGRITLGSTANLVFSLGDGVADTAMTFSGTLTNIGNALAALTYRGNSEFSGTDAVSIVVNDLGHTGSGGPQQSLGTIRVDVAAINDAPVLTVPAGKTVNEDSMLSITGISVVDVDAASSAIKITLSAANGKLSLAQTTGLTFSVGDGTSDSAMTFTGTLATVNLAFLRLDYLSNANFGGSDTINITVDDQGNTGSGGAKTHSGTVAVAVTAVNDAPVLTVPGAQSASEDTLKSITGIRVADVDAASGAIKITVSAANGKFSLAQTTGLTFVTGDGTSDAAMTFTGTMASVNAALARVDYLGNLNFNGADTLIFTVDDQGNTGSGGAKTDSKSVAITVGAVNDAPVLTVPGAKSVNEDTLLSITGISVADVDAATGAIRVTVSVAHGQLTLAQTTGLTFTAGDGTGDIVMTFTGTLANVNSGLARVDYLGSANYNGSDTLSITADDQGNTGSGGAKTHGATVAITVAAVNDAPTLVLPGSQSTDVGTRLTMSGVSLADVDAGTGLLQVSLSASHGRLTLATTAGLTFTQGDGTSDTSITMRGRLSALNTALAALRYDPNAGYEGMEQVQITVSDEGNTGNGGPKSAAGTIDIEVRDPNSLPFTVVSPTGTQWTGGSNLSFDIDYTRANPGYSFIDWNNSLKLWWRFDNDASVGEDATTVHDWSGNGYTGIISNATYSADGRYGGALNINDTGIVSAAHYGRWLNFLAEEDVTISMWTKMVNDSQHNYLVELTGDAGVKLNVYRHTNGPLAIAFQGQNDATTKYFNSSSAFPADATWHHFALVISKSLGEIRYYVDGNYGGKFTPAVPMQYMAFSGITAGGSYFHTNGQIDELLVFSRALDDNEVAAVRQVSDNRLQTSVNVEELQSYTYTVSHVSADGTLARSDAAGIFVDDPATAPVVELLSPIQDARRSGTSLSMTFSAATMNLVGSLSQATLYFGPANGTLSAVETIALSGNRQEASFTVSGLAAGAYAWNVVVRDSQGRTGTAAANQTFLVGQSEYHVATTGSDSNPGTAALPFRTIQKLFDIAKPGDTGIIHGGTYRESATLTTSGTARDPITIKAAPGETVVINGADLLTDWTQVGGEVYKAGFAGDLGRGFNQLFVNGVMVLEARYPNAGALFEGTRSANAIDANSSYTSTTMAIRDSDLLQPDDYWVGATVHAIWNPRYHSITGLVTDSSSGQILATLDTTNAGSGTMTSYGEYYLVGVLNALDQAGEWAVDDGQMYLWAPNGGNPNSLTVEVKQRQTGLTIDASYVHISDVQVFGCNIELTPKSSYSTLDGITGNYLSHYTVLDKSTMGTGFQGVRDTGIVIDGHHNTIQNSTLQYSAGNGVALLGHHNTVDSCDIGWVNYMITESAAVSLGWNGAYDNAVTNSTIHHSGRALIEHSGATSSDITHNRLYESATDGWAWDTGAIYATTSNGRGAQLSYNHIYDIHSYGIYFDIGCWDYQVHHNIVEDIGAKWYVAMLFNERGGMFQAHHNTVEGKLYFDRDGSFVTWGNSIRNNIASIIYTRVGDAEVPLSAQEGQETNNIEIIGLSALQQSRLFIDQANDDFHLGDLSAAIDFALDLGYVADFDGHARMVGPKPDAGAYEKQ